MRLSCCQPLAASRRRAPCLQVSGNSCNRSGFLAIVLLLMRQCLKTTAAAASPAVAASNSTYQRRFGCLSMSKCWNICTDM
jgi:hypothetical protein